MSFGNLPPVNNEDILKYALSLPFNGHTHALEFGVFEGRTTKIIKSQLPKSVEFYAFDSFEGLPEDWEDTVCKQGFFSTQGQIPNIPGVNWYKGWFSDTIPKYLKVAKPLCFVHIDCDLYSSTIEIFENLNNLIVSGTILCFDDWIYKANTSDPNHYLTDGEQKAFYEWIAKFNRKFEEVHFDTKGYLAEGKIIRIIK